LPRLFQEIYVPDVVLRELNHPQTPAAVKRWAQSPPAWLHVRTPTAMPPIDILDPGETAALALATELHATAILMDEKKGRRIATAQGFTTLGTITVLELAAQQNLVDLGSAFNAWSATSFQIAKPLLEAALARNAARRSTQQVKPH
jgi:predicted nucleic acid-binding protein